MKLTKLFRPFTISICCILLTGCAKPVQQYVVDARINDMRMPLDRDAIILVTIPAGFPQKDYNTYLETLPKELKTKGFREVWDTDFHELELKSVGIHDFSTVRNKEKLSNELGVRYLLEIEVLAKRYLRVSKLGATMSYNKTIQNSPYVGPIGPLDNLNYWLITRYILYDLEERLVMADLTLQTSHLENNSIGQKSIRKDLNKVFEFVYSKGG
ncbi:hypothetical protein ACFOUP_03965 [Belliella kenyensis]|uniref:Lipoprotein n=1 Tax=Belliella kenyensis TaxID=1472724 RepID=A0ABV8EI06_9BACT|nr:hypothetical protein [Belliella kenyensis]MCH7403063.1 hypothetical protein [Belliella kenyensis]MDN3602232.1 hypothetical protein [Belliella kenyensis]